MESALFLPGCGRRGRLRVAAGGCKPLTPSFVRGYSGRGPLPSMSSDPAEQQQRWQNPSKTSQGHLSFLQRGSASIPLPCHWHEFGGCCSGTQQGAMPGKKQIWQLERAEVPASCVCLSVYTLSRKRFSWRLSPGMEQLSIFWAEGFQACCQQDALAPDSRLRFWSIASWALLPRGLSTDRMGSTGICPPSAPPHLLVSILS